MSILRLYGYMSVLLQPLVSIGSFAPDPIFDLRIRRWDDLSIQMGAYKPENRVPDLILLILRLSRSSHITLKILAFRALSLSEDLLSFERGLPIMSTTQKEDLQEDQPALEVAYHEVPEPLHLQLIEADKIYLEQPDSATVDNTRHIFGFHLNPIKHSCGYKRWHVQAIFAVLGVLVIIGAAVGGSVGGTIAARSSSKNG